MNPSIALPFLQMAALASNCGAQGLYGPGASSTSTGPSTAFVGTSYFQPAYAYRGEIVPSDTSGPISVEEMAKIIGFHVMRNAGIAPDRRSVTADGSILLEYLQAPACVDVYPSGEAIVIVREGNVDNLYELRSDELKEITALLKDGTLAAVA